MDEKAIQQLTEAVARIESTLGSLQKDVGSIKPELESLRADVGSMKPELGNLRQDVGNIEQKAKQRDKTLRKEIRELRERASRDRDQMEMLKNQMQGAMVLGGGRGPEPVQYVPTGTGLIDPEWRWEREHPFRR